MSIDIKRLISDFWKYRDENKIELYNEDSLKFELGVYFRERLKGLPYKVQFERNIRRFGIFKEAINSKSEMDIVVLNDETKEYYAIELKYPRHGQHTQRVYDFIEDISFMEQVKKLGKFSRTFTMVVVDDDKEGNLFRMGGTGKNSMFDYFRSKDGDMAKNSLVNNLTFENPKNRSRKIVVEGDYDPISWIYIPRCQGISTSNDEEKGRHYYIVETTN